MRALWRLDLSSSTRGRLLPRVWTPLIILSNVTDVSSRNAVSSQSDASNYIFLSLYFFLCSSEATVWVAVLMWWRCCSNGSNDRLLPPGGFCLRGRVHQYSAARHREKWSQQQSVWGTPAFVLLKKINVYFLDDCDYLLVFKCNPILYLIFPSYPIIQLSGWSCEALNH